MKLRLDIDLISEELYQAIINECKDKYPDKDIVVDEIELSVEIEVL